MSALMKKPLTKVSIGSATFEIPSSDALAILHLVESINKIARLQMTSADVVFREVAGNRPKGAVYLKGIRIRENVSQKELEKKTGVAVSNISKYENGSRKITESVARKFAKALNVDFQEILEELNHQIDWAEAKKGPN